MSQQIADFVLDESKWLAIAMLLSIIAVVALALGRRRQDLPRRLRIMSAMNLFYGCVIGVMAVGHLWAVTIKVFQGSLAGSLAGSPWLLYALGVALAVPAGWLASIGARRSADENHAGRRSTALNLWLGIFLLALGIYNLPLAVPAALNVAYRFHTRRWVGSTLVAVTAAVYLALFVGSLIFFASGQSFEEFSGLQ